jgi:hypothetical protein
MKTLRLTIPLASILVSMGFVLAGETPPELSAAGGKNDPLPPSSLDFKRLIPQEFDKKWVFKLDDWIVWGADMVRTEDGTCHLLFSHWPKENGFDAWLTHSRIGYATAANPEGPYTFQGVALPYREGDGWDWMSHNPSIIAHDGKYYLYYTGTHGRNAKGREDFRMNMRVGVAVADHPSGPWKRFDKPLLDTGGEYGEGIVATPCAMVDPKGGILLYFKTQNSADGRFGKFGDGVMHYASSGESPLGPFKRHPKPMIDKSDYFPGTHFRFHIDDHEEWFQGDRYYAIVKDHDAPYLSKHGKVLHLMESRDGLDWTRSNHSFVEDLDIRWSDGTESKYQRLEMPKIHLEKGVPRVLFLAAREVGSQHSYNIAIPLKQGSE